MEAMNAVLLLALLGLLLVLCGWPLIRADALAASHGRAPSALGIFGYVLGYLGVIFIFVAAAQAAHT
jgi:hypothetical protein